MSLGTAVTGGAIACIAREVSAHLLESKPLAEAMARGPAPAAQPAAAQKLSGKLAVLELRNFTKDLTRENAQYFTDLVRTAALKAQPQLQVMTRENLLVLLQASGKDLANCEGECEVDTGRRIGADQIVSGEIQKVGTKYKLTLRLHDTHEGRLLASTQASGKTIDELDTDAQRAAQELLAAH
jgi:TolB-like protein